MLTSHVLLLYSCLGAVHHHHGLLSRIVCTSNCCVDLVVSDVSATKSLKRMDPPVKFLLVLRGGQSDEHDRSETGNDDKKTSPLSYMYDVENDLNEPV